MTKMMSNKKARITGKLTDDPNVIIKDMILSIEALKGLYRMENKALDDSDIEAFLELQEKKMTIAKGYQDKHAIIISRKDSFVEVGEDLKKTLEVMREEFATLAIENQKKLNRMKKTTKRLYEKVMDVARKDIEKRQVVYGAGGVIQKRKTNISVGIHETA